MLSEGSCAVDAVCRVDVDPEKYGGRTSTGDRSPLLSAQSRAERCWVAIEGEASVDSVDSMSNGREDVAIEQIRKRECKREEEMVDGVDRSCPPAREADNFRVGLE